MTIHAGKPAYRISPEERAALHAAIAQACRNARKKAGMTRQQIADAGGPSAAMQARIETGKYFGSLVTYYLMARAAGFSFATLVAAAVDGVAVRMAREECERKKQEEGEA